MIVDALSIAAYRVSLHGPGAELEGLFKYTYAHLHTHTHTNGPCAFGAEHRRGTFHILASE